MVGYVALAFAEKYKQCIERLVLLNSTTTKNSTELKQNRERAIEVVSVNKRAFIKMAIAQMFVDNSRASYASEIVLLTNEAFTFPTEGVIAAIQGMKERKDRRRVLENFQREKYVIYGEEDTVVPIITSKEIALETHSKLIILQGGHMSWLENKNVIVKVLRFIE
jgi:pimeloyl-ACP methyl ester carboxylesterase